MDKMDSQETYPLDEIHVYETIFPSILSTGVVSI